MLSRIRFPPSIEQLTAILSLFSFRSATKFGGLLVDQEMPGEIMTPARFGHDRVDAAQVIGSFIDYVG